MRFFKDLFKKRQPEAPKSREDKLIEHYTKMLNNLNHTVMDNNIPNRKIRPRIYTAKTMLNVLDAITKEFRLNRDKATLPPVPLLREKEMQVMEWLLDESQAFDTELVYTNFVLTQKLIQLLEIKKDYKLKSRNLDLLIANLSQIVDTLNA